MFWQLTINARDPRAQADFWAEALGYTRVAPEGPAFGPVRSWHRHYRHRFGAEPVADRIFDPEGLGPPLWFQASDEAAPGGEPLRLHVDVYPSGRDDALGVQERADLVEAKVATLVALGGVIVHRTHEQDDAGRLAFVVMRDPEGNVFCVA